jgi:hypothetical protein
MLNTSKDFRQERLRSKRCVKFCRKLGRITLKLLVVAPLLTKLVELVLVIVRWFRQ